MKRFLLLDIDGVLVRPLGYRAALRASVATFAEWMGFSDFQVEEGVIGDLEARGISSEFDMLPLLVGAVLQAVLSEVEIANLPEDLVEAAKYISAAHPLPPEAIHVSAFPLQDGCFPSEAAYRRGLYPALPEALRRSLLLNTRDVYRSPTTRLFQQFVLGSRRFEEVYNLPAQVQSSPYLHEYDQPLLDPLSCKRLESAWRSGAIHVAAMTARPSLPPRGVAVFTDPYPPEAEAALELIGLPDLPLIGLGKLDYVARKVGLPVESLLKPAPAQALAATLVAGGEGELAAIESVVAWLTQPSQGQPFNSLPREIELHVVEDTLGGVRSVRSAAEVLQQSEYSVTVYAWGLVDGNGQKRATLE
ncbi:MAG: hypothetical protein N3D16_08195, partial [Anaerolineales bacterium]|nr:hypothetical protein [Anaerolineales bacterium]